MRKYSIILGQLVTNLCLFGNLFWFKNPSLGFIFTFLWFGLNTYILGRIIKTKISAINHYWLGGLILVIFIIVFGAGIYYVFALTDYILVGLAATASVATTFISIKTPFSDEKTAKKSILREITWYQGVLIALFVLFIGYDCYLCFCNQTDLALESPWLILPTKFFITYLGATICLILATILGLNKKLVQVLFGLQIFFSLSIATIIYKLGFGYDPFIHQATEKVIFEKGLILPKPLFYLGQYSLVIFLSKFTQISLIIWDKLLIAILAAITLPPAIFTGLKSIFADFKTSKSILLSSILITLIPLTFFINTTPQGLAYLFLIVTIFLGLASIKKQLPIFIPYLFALAAIAIHPLAGIFALLYCLFLTLGQIASKPLKTALHTLLFVLSSVIIPIFFIINSKISNLTLSYSNNQTLFADLLHLNSLDYSIRDFIYFYKFYLPCLVIISSVIALWHLYQKKERQLFILPRLSVILLVNFIILKKFFVFQDLIEYERLTFSARLLEVALFFLLPLFLYAIGRLINFLTQKSFWLINVFGVCLAACLITTSLYLSYPRFDDYEENKGYNVSRADFEAVNFIENNAASKNYVVLAPQTTSAAALTTFGFEREINGYYFYPIPTGGKLYQYYLKMVYTEPQIEYLEEVSEITGATEIIFVLPKYWKNHATISDKLKAIANDNYSIEAGQIELFKFNFK